MILNASGRTDIPAFYGPWLLNRIAAGFFLSRNPRYPSSVIRYPLTPKSVDVLFFCSKNWAPLLPLLPDLARRFTLLCHGTITAYGPDIEPNVPPWECAAENLVRVAEIVGKTRVVWRYDPLLLTENYGIDVHVHTFARIARVLAGKVDRCIFSFLEPYFHVRRVMAHALVHPAQRQALAAGLAACAAKAGIRLQSCGTAEDFSALGILPSGCVTAARLCEATGRSLKSTGRKGGERQGCRCMDWRDVGAYNTCPHGCTYCYANTDHARARARYAAHDPASPMLCDRLLPTDTVQDGRVPLLTLRTRQGSLLNLP